MFDARSPTSPPSLEAQYYARPAGNGLASGLAIDTRNVRMAHDEAEQHGIYGSVSPRFRPSPQPGLQRQAPAAVYRSSSAALRPQGIRGSPERLGGAATFGAYPRAGGRSGQAELTPVTAWGHITAGTGGQGAGAHHAQAPSHMERDPRLQRALRAEGAASPPAHSAVRQDAFMTPPTAHRTSISTVLSGGPQAADATPRTRVRNNTTGTPASRRHSQAEFDAANYGLESQQQFARPNYNDPNMYAHTPGGDPHQAAMHALNRNRGSMSASAGLRSAAAATAATQDNSFMSLDSPGLAAYGVRPRRHSRVNSMASPPPHSRTRAIEETHNMLTGGTRAGRSPPTAQTAEDRHAQRMQAAHSWLGPGVGGGARDTQSDTFAWGVPGGARSRAGSFAVAGGARQAAHEPQPRGNGLSVENGRHPHRASYAGSGHGSHAASAVGSAQQPRGSGFVGGASARKSRHQSLQQKSGKTPIRSNWFHKEEMLSNSDVKDQEFSSSDEEDFGNEERDYGGDMVAQQKLIQKQQRAIFDLNMQCKMMQNSIGVANKEPYEALLHDFGRTCASNRRANREIEQLRAELKHLREQCADQEGASADPHPYPNVHSQYAEFEAMLDKSRRELAKATVEAKERNRDLEEKKADIRNLQVELERERLNSKHWRDRAAELGADAASPTRARSPQKQSPGSTGSPASNGPQSLRGRAGTTATASETATVREGSDASAGVDDQAAGLGGRLEAALRESEQKRRHAEEELKRTEKKMRDVEEQRRALQLGMKRIQDSRLVLGGKGDQIEISKLTTENEALKDDVDTLRRQLDDLREEAHEDVEAAVAAVRSLNIDRDEEPRGSAAQRAEIAQLQLECRDLEQQAQIREARVRRLDEDLTKTREQMHRLCHDYLRPRLREMTVGAAQAESVYDHVRRWSQLKVVVPAEDDATPTKSGPRHTTAQLAPTPPTGRFDFHIPASLGGRTSR
ncbi:hypothetical protein H4R19_000209 [Coemansia spiralis]|nr:hypothetical protein H4R19_000209 [Coemansia spiralis]